MSLTKQQVVDSLRARGINTAGWMLLDNVFEPVSADRLREIADACLDALPPELVTLIPDPASGPARRAPLWVAEAGDCESHSFVLFAWCIVGNWKRAVDDKIQRGGMACGPVIYTAQPRPENRGRSGRHSIIWHLDFLGEVRFYEFGDNAPTDLNAEEIASATIGFGA